MAPPNPHHSPDIQQMLPGVDPSTFPEQSYPARPRGFSGSAPYSSSQHQRTATSPLTRSQTLVETKQSSRPTFDLNPRRQASLGKPQIRRISPPLGPTLSRSYSNATATNPDPTFNASHGAIVQEPLKMASQAVGGAQEAKLNSPSSTTRSNTGEFRAEFRAQSPAFNQWGGSERLRNEIVGVGNGLRRSGRQSSGGTNIEPSARLRSRRTGLVRGGVDAAEDFALENIFIHFERLADHKINACVSDSVQKHEPDLDRLFGAGQDATFDRIVGALAHLSRSKSKALTQQMILWYQKHSIRHEVPRAISPTVTSTSNSRDHSFQSNRSHTDSQTTNLLAVPGEKISMQSPNDVSATRRSCTAAYVMYRVLTEVLSQTTLASLTLEEAKRLEHVVFHNQIREDREIINRSPMKQATWNAVVRLFGTLGELDFEGVSRRYLEELRLYHQDLSIKGNGNKDAEIKTEDSLRALGHLRLQSQPHNAWAQSCDFMLNLTDLFATVHGQRCKSAYGKSIEKLLLDLAKRPGPGLEDQPWRAIMRRLQDRSTQLANKPKYWQVAFPIQVVVACVSPLDIFMARYPPLFNICWAKLRERNFNKSVALKAICRIVWTYFNRSNDTEQNRIKLIDEVSKNVFFSGRKFALSADPSISEPLIELIRVIGYNSLDTCLRTIAFPLINSELLLFGKDVKLESLDPVKVVIGIRAFLAILGDMEKQEQPMFPVTFNDEMSKTSDFSIPVSNGQMIRSTTYQSRKPFAFKGERLSKPVIVSNFSERMTDHYNVFCKVLGRVAIICDEALGAQALTDEQKTSSATPKTPLTDTWSFSRKEDGLGLLEDREGFFELFFVAVQALPRCFSPHIQISPVVNLLCTGTTHSKTIIGQPSANSLLSIAKQGYAEFVIKRYSSFVVRYEGRFSSMIEGRSLGYAQVENALQLYIELLKIWIHEVEHPVKKSAPDLSPDPGKKLTNGVADPSFWNQVDRVEAQGLFFLCTPSPSIRALGVVILELVTHLESALGKSNGRIFNVLTEDSRSILDVSEQDLSIKDSSTLTSLQTKLANRALIDLCQSLIPEDALLWYKIFPRFIRTAFAACPVALALTKEDICLRLASAYDILDHGEDRSRNTQISVFEGTPERRLGSETHASENTLINHWKLHLMFVCVALTRTGDISSPGQRDTSHLRQSSKSSQTTPESFSTASDVFGKVIPMLFAPQAQVREAAVSGLGSVDQKNYKNLLETFEIMSRSKGDDSIKQTSIHQRVTSSPRRVRPYDLFHPEVIQVYDLTSHFILQPDAYGDEWILTHLSAYTQSLSLQLQAPENKQVRIKMQQNYCGLLENFYTGINQTSDPMRWMSFQARRAAYVLLEQWHYYPSGQEHTLVNESNSIIGAAALREARKLRSAASSAMAALCAGPMIHWIDKNSSQRFQVSRILEWIDGLFKNDGAKHHATGRRALKNLIAHNKQFPTFSESAIEKLYQQNTTSSLESYLEVLTETFEAGTIPDVPFWKILSALLFTLGNTESSIRMMSSRLLRIFEERQGNSSKLQDLEISIADKTRVVNRTAQFEMSERLVKQHPDLAFHVVSELSKYFLDLQPDLQRNMVNILIPWLKTIELQRTPSGSLTGPSYMILVNLIHITVKCHSNLDYEIQALWYSLSNEAHTGNVKLILEFVILLALDRRDELFIRFSKQIVVHLSSSRGGGGVIDSLLQSITPKKMLPDKPPAIEPPPDTENMPFVTPLERIFQNTASQANMSTGQLALILLVDLVVAEVKIAVERLPSLLQVVLVLWDHHTSIVQEQAREMLVHLIHELIISKLPDDKIREVMPTVEKLIDQIRGHHQDVIWRYEDNNDQHNAFQLPNAMSRLVTKSVSLFSLTYPGIDMLWGKTTVDWAINCPVRHLACRSLQLYRCLLKPLDQPTLSELVAKLASMISDDNPDVQIYCMEVIRALRTIAMMEDASCEPLLPQLFWATCACLDSSHEWEYAEALALLGVFFKRADLGAQRTVEVYMRSKPKQWSWSGSSLISLILKGCRSEKSYEMTLDALDRLIQYPANDLVGTDGRLLLSIIAVLPSLLSSFDGLQRRFKSIEWARNLVNKCEIPDQGQICSVLDDFVCGRARSSDEFLHELITALQPLLANFEVSTLDLLMTMLLNPLAWVKQQTLKILQCLVQELDMTQPRITKRGAEIISPLLALLHTEYSWEAMAVLDRMLPILNSVSEKRLVQQTVSGSQSKFAPPNEARDPLKLSGSSITMHSTSRNVVRQNLQDLHSMHAVTSVQGSPQIPTPEVEFWQDPFSQITRFADGSHVTGTENMNLEDSSMGDLVSKLNSLDDFFDSTEESDPSHSFDSPKPTTSFNTNTFEPYNGGYATSHRHWNGKSNESISLNNIEASNARNATLHERSIASPNTTTFPDGTPRRPSIGGRSITSPAVNQHTMPERDMPTPNPENEPFSDDDISAGRSNSGPLSRSRSNSRLGALQRRLTLTDKRRRPTLKTAAEDSPEVPRVPDAFLQNPKSSDI